MKKIFLCEECGTTITGKGKTKYCYKCSSKHRNKNTDKQHCIECGVVKTKNRALMCRSCARKKSQYKVIVSEKQKLKIKQDLIKANEIIEKPILSFSELQYILKELNIEYYRDSRKQRTFYKSYPVLFKHINYYTQNYNIPFYAKIVTILNDYNTCICGNVANWDNKNSSFENTKKCCYRYYKNSSLEHLISKNGPIKGYVMFNSLNNKRHKKGYRNKDWYIKNFGKNKGLKLYTNDYTHILNKRTTAKYSKISQVLFNNISKFIKEDDKKEGKLQYATNGYGEHRINFNKNDKKLIGEERVTMFVDFKYNNKIIEFDGDYWHQDEIYDNNRDLILKSKGYEILRIKEKDYKSKPQKEINKCLKFLNLL